MLADLPTDPRASSYDRLSAFLHNYAEIAATDFGRCLMVLTDADLSEAAGAHVRQGKASIDRKIRGLITSGIADGSIADCDAKLTAFMIAGAINGISRWYRDGVGLSSASVARIYVNQLGAGLLPRRD